jgi:hypothetical protein
MPTDGAVLKLAPTSRPEEAARVSSFPNGREPAASRGLLCALTEAWVVATAGALFIVISNRARETSSTTALIRFSAAGMVAVFCRVPGGMVPRNGPRRGVGFQRPRSAMLTSALLLAHLAPECGAVSAGRPPGGRRFVLLGLPQDFGMQAAIAVTKVIVRSYLWL